MITDEMIAASKRAIAKARYSTSMDLIKGVVNARCQIYEARYAQASLEAVYPLIRQQVLKEVNDAIGKHEVEGSFDRGYWAGVKACQRIVRDMMEGGE